MPSITSPANPRVKNVVRLQKQPRHRRDTHRFCIESARELDRALDAGFDVVELYVCEELFDDRALIERALAGSGAYETVSRDVLAKMAYRENPEGFVAVLEWRPRTLDGLERTPDEWFIVCSGLEKPGNLGAILRSADAAGVSAVLVDRESVDLYNPNCVRASTGAAFALPVICAEADDLTAALARRGVRLIAVTPDSGRRYFDADLTGPIALVLGAEAEGLSEAWRGACGSSIGIPMHGAVDSVNVSVAASVVMFEAARQRGASAG